MAVDVDDPSPSEISEPASGGYDGWVDIEIDSAGRVREATLRGDYPRALRRIIPGVLLLPSLEWWDAGFAGIVDQALRDHLRMRGSYLAGGRWRRWVVSYDVDPSLEPAGRAELRFRHAGSRSDEAQLAGDLQRGTQALGEFLGLLNGHDHPEPALRDALPLLVDALDMESGAVFAVRSEGRAEMVSAYGPTKRRSFPYPHLDLADQAVSSLLEARGVRVLSARARDLEPALAAVCHPRLQTALVAPAFARHDLVGVLVISTRHVVRLSGDQHWLVSAAADALGLALGNVQLSRRTDQSEAVIETALAVARAISNSLDLRQTFSQIAHSAARVMGDSRCLLLELHAGGDLVACAHSDPADENLLGMRVRFDDYPNAAVALRDRRSLVVDDTSWGASVSHDLRSRLDVGSALFVPIRSEDALIGSLLMLGNGKRRSYSAGDLARAEAMAEQAASAICNARLYHDLETSRSKAQALLDRLTVIREEQRLSLANLVHDDIVQMVVAALYEVEDLREQVPEDRVEDIDRVARLLRSTIDDARRIVWELRPAVLEGLGLRGALAALADRVSAPVAVHVRVDDVPDVSPGVATAAYMIAREAFVNATRHAKAKSIWLTFTGARDRPDCVRLEVRDDGRGFSLEEVDRQSHFGLTMMNEQAATVGAVLSLDSAAGDGTRIEVLFPLRRA